MKQSPCSNLYFPAGNGALTSPSYQPLNISTKIGGYNINSGQQRAFIPFVGLELDGSGASKVLSVASNKANKNAFYDWFIAGWFASRNYVEENLVNKDQIVDGDNSLFASYLYKKVNNDIYMQGRYTSIGSLVWDFWDNADAAWTATQYAQALRDFQDYLVRNADKNLYIAPNRYSFDSAAPTPNDSGLGADILAWKTATPAFVAFGAVEVSIQ